MTLPEPMTKAHNPLIINVGFLVKSDVGSQRDFEFEIEEIVLPPDLSLTDLRGNARFGRTPQGLVADMEFSARTTAECARCLEEFDLAIASEFTELYAFDERWVSESQLLLPANHQIDLSPLTREYMLLDLPITPLCRPDCKGLCPVCGANRNDEDCGHQQDEINPKFSALKDLLDE
jgi:uncharacterized protein